MAEKMDEIDQRQQFEITELQKKDVHHDRDFFWLKIFGFVVVMWTILSTIAIVVTLQKTSPYNCPHPECVHHRNEVN